MREAANASQLRRNFQDSDLLYVPEVHWDLCRGDVMVMERIHGVLISELPELRRLGTNIQRLAENGVQIFFTQVFRHNFFHADMHPGNIFVRVEDPEHPRYAAVDFGIVGTLDTRDQHYLAENFLAFFDRDYNRVARLHIDSGWVPPGTRVDELESAVRTVCEPIFQKPLSEISFAQVLLRLFETARRFQMEVQPQLILLQKTLLQIEGLGRQLYPELDLWKTAQPILREWAAERMSGRVVRAGTAAAAPGSRRSHPRAAADAAIARPARVRRPFPGAGRAGRDRRAARGTPCRVATTRRNPDRCHAPARRSRVARGRRIAAPGTRAGRRGRSRDPAGAPRRLIRPRQAGSGSIAIQVAVARAQSSPSTSKIAVPT